MKYPVIALLLFACTSSSWAQEKSTKISWKKTIVDRQFRSEGVAIADVNKDGKADIIVGDVWYEAPAWKMHSLRKESTKGHNWNKMGYAEAFGIFAEDINRDGYPDAIVIPFPGKKCFWYENPKGKPELWKEHELANISCNESPMYVDLFKTGQRVLVMGWRPGSNPGNGEVCYFRPGDDPTKPWIRTSISGPSKDGKDVPGSYHFYHGLGAGDVNGDGRLDVLVPDGWWEQPEKQDGKPWTWHAAKIGPNCADMYVTDVDGDGKGDVISSSAHGYGLWWHQQKPGNTFLTKDFFAPPPALAKEPEGFKFNKEEQALYEAVNKLRLAQKRAPWAADAKLCEMARRGEITPGSLPKGSISLVGDTLQQALSPLESLPQFKQGLPPSMRVGVGFANGRYSIFIARSKAFSLPGQTHALHFVDINGDGLKDLVTGRRTWAHGPNGDVSPADPSYLYWFEGRRDKSGMLTFEPHEIDDDSGIGTQFEVADINGDGLLDIIISNKNGVFVFEQMRTKE